MQTNDRMQIREGMRANSLDTHDDLLIDMRCIRLRTLNLDAFASLVLISDLKL